MTAQLHADSPALLALRAAASWRTRGRACIALRSTAFSLRGAASGILGLNHMLPTLQITSGSLRGPALHQKMVCLGLCWLQPKQVCKHACGWTLHCCVQLPT